VCSQAKEPCRQDFRHLIEALLGGYALGVEGVGHYAKPLGAILTMANLKQ
jgi:hypothetical protein